MLRDSYRDPARHHARKSPLAILQMLGLGKKRKNKVMEDLLSGPSIDPRMSNQAAVTGSGLGLGFGFRSAGPDPRGNRNSKNLAAKRKRLEKDRAKKKKLKGLREEANEKYNLDDY